jgi:superfamily II DNA helicase RecQ
MQIRLFNVPLTDDGTAQAELNRFLSGHKVLEVEQRFYQNEKDGCWTFCVRYIQNAAASSPLATKVKIDYKTVLNEAEFAMFASLREIRKQLATEDAVPAYAVFTDEELASIVRSPNLDVASLASIKGIGQKKVDKYGKQMIELYKAKTGAL